MSQVPIDDQPLLSMEHLDPQVCFQHPAANHPIECLKCARLNDHATFYLDVSRNKLPLFKHHLSVGVRTLHVNASNVASVFRECTIASPHTRTSLVTQSMLDTRTRRIRSDRLLQSASRNAFACSPRKIMTKTTPRVRLAGGLSPSCTEVLPPQPARTCG